MFGRYKRMQTLNNNQKCKIPSHLQARFVQTLDNAIHRINHYLVDIKVLGKPIALFTAG